MLMSNYLYFIISKWYCAFIVFYFNMEEHCVGSHVCSLCSIDGSLILDSEYFQIVFISLQWFSVWYISLTGCQVVCSCVGHCKYQCVSQIKMAISKLLTSKCTCIIVCTALCNNIVILITHVMVCFMKFKHFV